MKKRFAAAAMAVVVAMLALATTAQATPTKTSACTGCHSKSTSVVVKAVQTANDGVNAKYSITVTGPNPIKGWAVLSGSTNLAHATAGTGTFTVPVGKTYAVWGVSKTSGGMPSSNSISISPAKPATPPTGTPVPTTTPTVTPTIIPKSSFTMRRTFLHKRGTIVRFTNIATGKRYVGHINRLYTKVSFKNVPNGVYKLTVKYAHRKTKTVGLFNIIGGHVTKYVPPSEDEGEND